MKWSFTVFSLLIVLVIVASLASSASLPYGSTDHGKTKKPLSLLQAISSLNNISNSSPIGPNISVENNDIWSTTHSEQFIDNSTTDYQQYTTDSSAGGSDYQQYTTDSSAGGSDYQQYTTDSLAGGSDHQQYTANSLDGGTDHQQYTTDSLDGGTDHQQYTTDSATQVHTKDGNTPKSEVNYHIIPSVIGQGYTNGMSKNDEFLFEYVYNTTQLKVRFK